MPERWRSAIGKTTWSQSFGAIPPEEARVKARELADKHDAILARLEAGSVEESLRAHAALLREQARLAKKFMPRAAHAIDIVLFRELKNMSWTPSSKEESAWVKAMAKEGELFALGMVTAAAEAERQRLKHEAEERRRQSHRQYEGQTLLTALDEWRAMRGQRDERWRQNVQRVHALVDFLGYDAPLALVTPADAETFIKHLKTTPGGHGKPRLGVTVLGYRDSLAGYFGFALGQDWVSRNPFDNIVIKDERPDWDNPRIPFHFGQAIELRNVARTRWAMLDRPPGRGRDLMLALDLLMALGMRPTEVCQLHVDNIVDVDGLVIDISGMPIGTCKEWRPRFKNRNARRALPVPDGLTEAVAAQKARAVAAGSHLFFPSFHGLRGYASALIHEATRHVKPNCSFASDEKLVLYSHRHRFADIGRAFAPIPHQIFQVLFGHRNDEKAGRMFLNRQEWMAEKRRCVNHVFPCVFEDWRPEQYSAASPGGVA